MVKYVEIPKNTDKNCFYNDRHSKVCKICNKTKAKIINHYVKNHKGSEVFISRLSPEMAVAVKNNVNKVQCLNTVIEAICYFCEFEFSKTFKDWLLHFTMHTGEYMYSCTKCNNKVSGSHHCQRLCSESPQLARKTQGGDLTAFICNDCNYIQLNEENLVRHLRQEHDLNGDIKTCYQEIVLVPSIVQRHSTLCQDSRQGNYFHRRRFIGRLAFRLACFVHPEWRYRSTSSIFCFLFQNRITIAKKI